MMDIYLLDKKPKKINDISQKNIWVDVTSITPKEAALLKERFSLHPVTIEDISNSNVRVKVEQFPDYLFCVFYSIKKAKEIQLTEVDFIVGKDFIITNHQKEIPSTKYLKENPSKISDKKDFLFHKILDMEIDNYPPILEIIDDQIEDIEEEITKKATPSLLSEVLKIKRQLVAIKKISFPQREKISLFTKNTYPFISKRSLPYFRDLYDHVIRISDTVENYRESAANTFDVYMSAVSNNMNDVMKTLSIIATIALPLTVISGIYGTNFANLPGENNPYGFWIMIIAMFLLSVFMVLFFKRRKWF